MIFSGLFVVGEAMGVSHVTDFVATVLRIRTPDGTLLLEVEDPAIGVQVDGRDVVHHRRRASRDPPAARPPPGDGRQGSGEGRGVRHDHPGGRRLARVDLDGPSRPRIEVDGPGGARDTTQGTSTTRAGGQTQYDATDVTKTEVLKDTGPAAVSKTVDTATVKGIGGGSPAPLAIEPAPPPETTPRVELKTMGSVQDIAFSPDGRYLVALAAGPSLNLYDTAAKGPAAVVDASTKELEPFLHLKDGRQSFTLTRQLESRMGQPSRLGFSRDGKRLATSGGNNLIQFWDFDAVVGRRGRKVPSPGVPRRAQQREYLKDIHDALRLLDRRPQAPGYGRPRRQGEGLGRGDGTRLARVPEGTLQPAGLPRPLLARWKMIAVSTSVTDPKERSVQLWEIVPGDPPKAVSWGVLNATQGQPGFVASLAFSPKTGALITYGMNLRTVAWDIKENRGNPVFVPNIWHLCFSADGSVAATMDSKSRVLIWDADDAGRYKWRATFRASRTAIPMLALSPDGKTLATADPGNSFLVRVWDVPEGPPKAAEEGSSTKEMMRVMGAQAQAEPRRDGNERVTAVAVAAARELAKTLVEQAGHRLAAAEADKRIAETKVSQAKSEIESTAADRDFRKKELDRTKALAEASAVPRGLSTRRGSGSKAPRPPGGRPRKPSSLPRPWPPRRTLGSRRPGPSTSWPG